MIRFTHRVFLVVVHWLRSRDDCWGVFFRGLRLSSGSLSGFKVARFLCRRLLAFRCSPFGVSFDSIITVQWGKKQSPSSLRVAQKASHAQEKQPVRRFGNRSFSSSSCSRKGDTERFPKLPKRWFRVGVIPNRPVHEKSRLGSIVTRNQAEINVLGFELSYSSILSSLARNCWFSVR